MEAIGLLSSLDQIDETGVVDAFDKMHKLFDHFFLFLAAER